MEEHQIVPDVISTLPLETAKITYAENIVVDHGNLLKRVQVKHIPEVQWNADPESVYTLCLTDPDAPNRIDPIYREWQHWVVVNIPGTDIENGETLSEYVGSAPGKDTGLHRYVFLIYKQKGKMNFDEKRLTKNSSREDRRCFKISKFAQKYELGNAVAGNFYLCKWDE